MLDYVYGHDQLIAQFVAQLIPSCRARGFNASALTAMGIIDGDGRLVAGMVYHNWDPEAGVLEMSGAALPGVQWLSRETIRRMYSYPFLQCGLPMIFMRVEATDARLLRQLAALNYDFIKIPRLGGRDKDTVLCLLTREDWEANKFCKRFKHHVDATPKLEEAA